MAAMKRTTTTKTYVAKANGRRESVTKREASTLSQHERVYKAIRIFFLRLKFIA